MDGGHLGEKPGLRQKRTRKITNTWSSEDEEDSQHSWAIEAQVARVAWGARLDPHELW